MPRSCRRSHNPVSNTLVGYTIWVEEAGAGSPFQDGDLSFNHLPVDGKGSSTAIVTQGKYQGPADWADQLSQLKQGGVERIYFSTLGKFSRIQSLIQKYGTGEDSVLYQNFAALKAALPIDGIDLDDEDLYDQDTSWKFSRMLHAIGLEVSFCPYAPNWDYWANLLASLNTEMTPNVVTGFNLQCYGGGEPDRLKSYIDAVAKAMAPMGWTKTQAAAFVSPGFYCWHADDNDPHNNSCPVDILRQYASWMEDQNITGLQGGFLYIYDSLYNNQSSSNCGVGMPMNAVAYANSIIQGSAI